MRLDPAVTNAEPELIAEGLYEGRGMRVTGDGRMLLFDTRAPGGTSNMYILDPATGETDKCRSWSEQTVASGHRSLCCSEVGRPWPTPHAVRPAVSCCPN